MFIVSSAEHQCGPLNVMGGEVVVRFHLGPGVDGAAMIQVRARLRRVILPNEFLVTRLTVGGVGLILSAKVSAWALRRIRFDAEVRPAQMIAIDAIYRGTTRWLGTAVAVLEEEQARSWRP